MISPYRIKFRNKFNTDFDLICGCSFDSDHGNTESFFNKEVISSNIYDGSRRNIHGYKYSEIMNVQFTLIKQDYSDISDRENRQIIAWLTGSNKVEELIVYKDDSEVISYRLIGNIINIEQYKMANNRVVGMVINFEHISPYAYSPVKTVTKTVTSPEEFVINCRSDVYEKLLYPKITVTMGGTDNNGVLCMPVDTDPTASDYTMVEDLIYKYNKEYYIKINGLVATKIQVLNTLPSATSDTYNNYYLNLYDQLIYKGTINDNGQYAWEKLNKTGAGVEIKNTYFENGQETTVASMVTDCFKGESIILDGDNKIISSTETSKELPIRIFGDSFNWQWIGFVPGENSITISGNCTVKFEWVEPIKIGNL